MARVGDYAGCLSDGTTAEAAEAALRESEAYLEAILDSTADGILAVDNSGKVLKANRRFAELWHIPTRFLRAGTMRRCWPSFWISSLIRRPSSPKCSRCTGPTPPMSAR